MRRITLCADDYAIAPGVSAAIRELIAAGRLNATSVMTVFPGLDADAAALAEAARGRRVSLGLHLTLTGPIRPLTAGMAEPGGTLPTLRTLIGRACARRLDPEAVAAELEAQFAAFRAAFGRPPDHVDGHQHVHVLPTVRRAVLAATRRHAPKAWLRDVVPAPAALRGLDLKGRLIGAFGYGFAGDAAAAGLATSRGFAGAYDFGGNADFADLLRHFLAGLPEGGLAMVHPGRVDAVLPTRDPLTGPREAELAVLAGPQLPAILAATGVRLD